MVASIVAIAISTILWYYICRMKKIVPLLWLLIAALFSSNAMAQETPEVGNLLAGKGSKAPKVDIVYQRVIDGTTWLATKTGSKYVVYYHIENATIANQRGDNGGTVVTVNRQNGTSLTFNMPKVKYPNDEDSFIFWKPKSRTEIDQLVTKAGT